MPDPITPATPPSGGTPAPASPAPSSPSVSPSHSTISQPSTPSASPAPAPQQPVSGSSALGVDVGQAPPASPAAQAVATALSLRDQVARMDPALAGQFNDDASLAAYLIQTRQQMQQVQGILPYAQQYAQHAPQFQAWMQQQQAAAQAAQAAQKKWFNAPDYDPNWRHQIFQDPQSGEWKVKPGNPPDLIERYTKALQHQQGFLDKFAFDPVGAIKPGLEEVVREVAGQLIKQQLGGYQEQNTAQGFIEENKSWLFAQNPQTGQRQLTEWGQRFGNYVQEAENFGMRTVEQQQKYAMNMVQRDYALSQYQKLTAAQQPGGAPPAQPAAPALSPNDLAKQQFLQQGQRPAAPAAPPAHAPGTATPQQPVARGGSHTSRLTQMLLANGRTAGLVNGDVTIPG